MAAFRTLTADDVRELLLGFGPRAAPGAYRSHTPIAVGTINTNARIETAAGPLFLRVNEGKTEDDVRREAAIVSHAAARGVPTPAPLVAAGGDPFVRWRDGALVSLFPWVAGRTLGRAEVTPAHAAAVGCALATLHLADADFDDRRPGRYEPDEIRRRFDRVAKLVASGEGGLRPPEPIAGGVRDPSRVPEVGHPELRGAVAVLGPELEALEAARAPSLPLGIIHGDLFIDNVMFDGDQLVALIDFEQASWGRLAYDLAVTALAFGFGRDQDFRAEILRALLDAYAAMRPPTADERAAFGAELRFAACRFAVTRITDVHLKREAGAAPGKDFRRYLARLAAVRAHLDARDGLLDLSG
jgi:homoserine kinase type II